MTGRGSWTRIGGTYQGYYAYVPAGPLVGRQAYSSSSVDPDYYDYRAVWAGVKAIQQTLNVTMALNLAVDGVIGAATGSAIVSFQHKAGLATDGMFGPHTAKALFGPLIAKYQDQYGIPDNLLAGVLDLESEGLDPGSVGEVSAQDCGLAQFHVDGGSTWWNTHFGLPEQVITKPLCFGAAWSIHEAAKRMAYYAARFSAKGTVLQQNCMIAQHNAPGSAQSWYVNGTAPTAQIQNYVSAVKKRAAAY